MGSIFIGAEAVVSIGEDFVEKKRLSKSYRDKILDMSLISSRIKREGKLLDKALSLKINVPKVLLIDLQSNSLKLERLHGMQVKEFFDNLTLISNKKEFGLICGEIGRQLAVLHSNNMIHGDLTTSNLIICKKRVFFIDFGLSFISQRLEDKAVDLHVLHEALIAKHFPISGRAFELILKAYERAYAGGKECSLILSRLSEVESRGRNKAHF